MNLPNKLTVLGVIMVPFFVFFMLTDVGGVANKWIALVLFIIAREFIISGFRLVASDNGVVIAANYWGKFKTVSQMAMIIVLIADFGGVFDMVGTVLIWIATALTVISLVDYVWANREVLTKGGM